MQRFKIMRILSLLILLTVSQLQAQHPFLASFTGSAVSDGVFLEWTINQGSTCQGIVIERADENGEFMEIGRIEEVCGSIIEPVDYDYLDESPRPGVINEYRLILGLDGTTDVVSVVYFNVDEAGYSLILNERTGQLNVFSLEPITSNNGLLIYDVNGREVKRYSLDNSSTSVDVSDLNAGLFFVTVTEKDEVVHVARIVKPT